MYLEVSDFFNFSTMIVRKRDGCHEINRILVPGSYNGETQQVIIIRHVYVVHSMIAETIGRKLNC